MVQKIITRSITALFLLSVLAGCKTLQEPIRSENKTMPLSFGGSKDSATVAQIKWREYFQDEILVALIDSALSKNQELNISLQEIEILRNEVRERKGEYLPNVGIVAAAGFEKEGRYTRNGAVDEHGEILPGKKFPDPLGNYEVAAVASWEVDIWKKLRNSKKAAALRYLAGSEGRNFLVTNIIAEIASSYYELLALDNLLSIIQQNIEIQSGALEIVRQQKTAAKLTQLAVNRFEAQLLKTTNLQYEVRQQITETENRLHFLTGSFPGRIPRDVNSYYNIFFDSLNVGIPSQLLSNRPDIRQAEFNLAAAKLDVQAARAEFYPSLRLVGGVGYQAFNLSYLVNPESVLFNLAGDLVVPLVNRNAIKARYSNATARQIQLIYDYEQTILRAYIDVVNQMSRVQNFQKSYQTKAREADILMQSVGISNSLFRSARADYLEVLLTQQEALESKMELVEIKQMQLNARVNIYRALGGGWN